MGDEEDGAVGDDNAAEDRPVGVILAGGRARRLGGGDKPLRLVGGRPLLARALERLSPQCRLVLLNANGPADRYAPFGLRPIPDHADDREAGPLAGVLAGLDAVAALDPTATRMLTVPGDAPFLPLDLVDRLTLAQAAQPALVAAASSAGRRHPTVALWPLGCREALRRLIRHDGVRRVEAVLDQLGTAWAAWPDTPFDPFHNINTPADLATADRLAQQLAGPAQSPAGQDPAPCL